jgi:hypothetical protein
MLSLSSAACAFVGIHIFIFISGTARGMPSSLESVNGASAARSRYSLALI